MRTFQKDILPLALLKMAPAGLSETSVTSCQTVHRHVAQYRCVNFHMQRKVESSEICMSGISNLRDHRIHSHCFDFSLLVSTNRVETTWLAIGFPHPPAAVLITSSSVERGLALREVDCFCA